MRSERHGHRPVTRNFKLNLPSCQCGRPRPGRSRPAGGKARGYEAAPAGQCCGASAARSPPGRGRRCTAAAASLVRGLHRQPENIATVTVSDARAAAGRPP